MGWIAVTKDLEVIREGEQARPVQQGEEGNLRFILQEDFGQRVAIDLVNGVIIVGYDFWEITDEDIQILNPRTVLYICDETNIIAGLLDVETTEPNEEGIVFNTYKNCVWRPIWFTRHTGEHLTKVIGAQTTLPLNYGGKNVKKMVSLFDNGAVGID